jgi:hypothetical protein
MWSPFRRRVRREQVSAPLNLDVVLLLKLIDPYLADVAEWSDIVREDNDWNRLVRLDFQCDSLSEIGQFELSCAGHAPRDNDIAPRDRSIVERVVS